LWEDASIGQLLRKHPVINPSIDKPTTQLFFGKPIDNLPAWYISFKKPVYPYDPGIKFLKFNNLHR
jgi:hypothetical protein